MDGGFNAIVGLFPALVLAFSIGHGFSFAWTTLPHAIPCHRQQLGCSSLSNHRGVALDENSDLVGTHETSPRQWLESLPNGAYTVLRCDSGGFCQGLDFHLDRLQDSFGTFGGSDAEDITTQAATVLDEVTKRGLDWFGHPGGEWMVTLLAYITNNSATVLGHLYQLGTQPANTTLTVALIEGSDLPTRQPHPRAKLSSWCTDRKPLEELQAGLADDTILLDPEDGSLLEGLTSNLFVVRSDGTLQTAPAHCVLPGYMRYRVMESGVFPKLTYAPIYARDSATDWKGLFLTSSIRTVSLIHKVVRIDATRGGGVTEVVWEATPANAAEMHRLCERLRIKLKQTPR